MPGFEHEYEDDHEDERSPVETVKSFARTIIAKGAGVRHRR